MDWNDRLRSLWEEGVQCARDLCTGAPPQKIMVTSTPKTVSEYRLKGNAFFKNGDFKTAIEQYKQGLKAIEASEDSADLDEDRVKFFLNLSQSYGGLSDWTASEKSAREALNISHHSHKAYYLLGKALAKQGRYAEALSRLHRAESFASTKEDQELIQNLILEVERTKWEVASLEKLKVDQSILNNLDAGTSLTRANRDRVRELIEEEKARRQIGALPPFLVCPINQTLLRNPVIMVPSGNTYEKETAEAYIQNLKRKKEALTDPISREPIQDLLIPNHAVRYAALEFLERNPWAASEWL
eukprot:Gregarina_sp_Pseudo_9__1059@NODE_1688_length_1399_cov_5_636029_g1564_i0_p1_GENE_NODE_1688_length_1399_cov_5_636029_g1564_i0NODE_1688_length_1399_cov_5_636029_g1564_i0_p1_ORF_typecomplete_len300_score50_44Ubox/PF04564_15/1_3e03Ubox/PF04564_15/1_1e13TPR_16/PF13432_6/0_093TPR_16/PF13432_6/0_0049TPR_16/PF13432_6/2_3e06TPR_MalT/PF17874_1/7_3e11ANAPC3/PF12895_7/0_036ANAPC3/PF12895_7/1_1e06ANAPC3/PF12895_7/3_7e03TPR_12/PF13424_6/5_9e05TPR_12/PF13424_6/0_014TPR_15/PF13429_6/5e08TPR_15/PF13429_6/5_9e02TP